MALFKAEYQSGNFSIRHSDQLIDLSFQSQGDPISAQLWDDRVEVYEVSRIHSKWFSQILGMNCRLVSFLENYARPVDPRYAINNDHVRLADGYPCLIIGQSSLDDLNSQMQEPLPMNRYRPNIVLTGAKPYEEDGWRNFMIGQNRFTCVKPCSRCVFTTVNQDTDKKGIEPLATLSAYRMRENKIYFGQNVIPIDHNEIAERDEIVFE